VSFSLFFLYLIPLNWILSWTIMTWIVVFGSSLVMMLWIVVFSFFPSNDFVNEFLILFGTIYFWASVLLAATICLGAFVNLYSRIKIYLIFLAPRFIFKYVSSVYFPLDKDIVREMWVMGDLKDQLGLSHRKPKKNHKSQSALEAAPMFREQHSRSISEFSTGDNNYEPALPRSPAINSTLRQTYLDTPPMIETVELPPTGVQYAQVTNPINDIHLSPLHVDPRQQQASPQPSYYSASDLPPSSPLPSPQYRYPTGEVTKTPPSRPTSVSRVPSVTAPHSPMPTAPLPPQPSLLVPGPYTPRDSTGYEMRVRSGQSSYTEGSGGSSHEHLYRRSASETSHASYATAADDLWIAESDGAGAGAGGSVGGHHQPTQLSTQSHSHSQGTTLYSHQQQHSGDDDDDGETVTDHRPVSIVSTTTWEGGMAL
jgi:phospholipid-translocating ATPase